MARQPDTSELTYPLRAAARLTGLSPTLLRAWESRHGVVNPARTPGGTRRYSAADIERLRLLKAAVDAGSRIGEVAGLDATELRRRATAPEPNPSDALAGLLGALDRLEGPEAQRLLAMHFAALGPVRFARDLARPLVQEIGERWASGTMGIAAEHLATAVLRTQLGNGLQPTAASLRGPRIIFATPAGERHELGLLMAALTALGAGANPLYLGAELPLEDVLGAVESADASVLALSLVTLPAAQIQRTISALRGGLPDRVHLWLGGSAANENLRDAGVEVMGDLDELQHRIELLGLESTQAEEEVQ